LYYLLPFVIAFIISLFIEPLIVFLEKRLHLRRWLSSLISILFFIAAFGVLSYMVIIKVFNEIKQLISFFAEQPDWFNNIVSNVNKLISKANTIYVQLPDQITDSIKSTLESTSSSFASFITGFLQSIIDSVISVPQVLIFIIVTIIALYFLTSDRNKIYKFVRAQFSEYIYKKIVTIKNDMFSALLGYLKAYMIIMSITFIELAIGLSVIGIEYSILLALVICVVDILPILGSGTILIPWILYCLFTGDITKGVSILVVYAIIFIVRQLIEPKIVGKQIGLHPLVTLFAMYTGLQFFGVLGLILGTLVVILIKSILVGILKGRTINEYVSEKMKKPAENH